MVTVGTFRVRPRRRIVLCILMVRTLHALRNTVNTRNATFVYAQQRFYTNVCTEKILRLVLFHL